MDKGFREAESSSKLNFLLKSLSCLKLPVATVGFGVDERHTADATRSP
jgi:hypothetical protein